MLKVQDIPIKKCVPMPEVDREFYNAKDYAGLKRVIRKDGYDRSYPIRAIYDSERKLYEVFDGIHRMKIMKELGKPTIPAIIEKVMTRADVIAKGIKANQHRSANNPIDLARSLHNLGEIIGQEQQKVRKTKPSTLYVYEIAERMCMTPSKVSELLKLMRLPKRVISLLGEGKLRFYHGKALCSLLGTAYESEIIRLAEMVVKEDLSFRALNKEINALKHTGKIQEEIAHCDDCGKAFPRIHMNTTHICPACFVKKHSKKTPAMRRYDKFYDFVERIYTRRDEHIPKCAEEHLEKLRLEYREAEKIRIASLSKERVAEP